MGTVRYNIIFINLYREKNKHHNLRNVKRDQPADRHWNSLKNRNLVVLSGPAAVRPRLEHESGGSDPVPARLGLPYTGEIFFKKMLKDQKI